MKKVFVQGLFAIAPLLFVSLAYGAANPDVEAKIKQGHQLFTSEKFQGNGRVCETCHVAGGHTAGHLPNGKAMPSLMNAAAVFPRIRQGRVTTLEDQIRKCVGGAIEGTPPEYGSEELGALSVYITSLSQGKAIDLGGSPQ
ncbi:MAG: cytochrome C [Betaproteobacteria bacterium]|nr:cytochrome C [Betaproteobacteria bacterium]